MKKKINIIWSATFMSGTSLKDIEDVLNEAIEDIAEQDILGVELRENGGSLRFWIYTK